MTTSIIVVVVVVADNATGRGCYCRRSFAPPSPLLAVVVSQPYRDRRLSSTSSLSYCEEWKVKMNSQRMQPLSRKF